MTQNLEKSKLSKQIADEPRKKALLVSTHRGGEDSKKISEEHLDELELLVDTFGMQTAHKNVCTIRKIEASTYVSSGKLQELILIAQEHAVDAVIFDDEITPSQQRNLEKAFKIVVMDRAEVILGVFAERAQTKEARLQIELAQTKYQAPRLKRMWTHLSRQAGTGGVGAYLKGKGETQIEMDRRQIKQKVEKLQGEIDAIRANRETQRSLRERSDIPVFAIIGYTNAGKSTLLNALTNANVFVEDKLFATLDTTTRKYTLPNNQDILLIDTVGFIRKLPHLLVMAFRGTLEEAVQADILIHLIDVSHPMAEEQADAALEVLKELNAEDKPIITVFNKIDKCENQMMFNKLRLKYSKNIQISALNQTGFDELIDLMIQELSQQRKPIILRIPQSEYKVVSEVIRVGTILNQEYEGNEVILKAILPIAAHGRLQQYIEKETIPKESDQL